MSNSENNPSTNQPLSETNNMNNLRQFETAPIELAATSPFHLAPGPETANSVSLSVRPIELDGQYELALTTSWCPPPLVQNLAWGAYSVTGKLVAWGRTDAQGKCKASLPKGQLTLRFVDDIRAAQDIDILLRVNDRRSYDHLNAVLECEDVETSIANTIRARLGIVPGETVVKRIAQLLHATGEQIAAYVESFLRELQATRPVPAFAPVGRAESGQALPSEARQPPHPWGGLRSDGTLALKIPREELPYDILVLCVAVKSAGVERIVQTTWCLPSSIQSKTLSFEYTMSDLGIELKDEKSIQIVPADFSTLPLFSLEDIRTLENVQLSDPDAKKRIAEFVELYKRVSARRK